MQNQRWAVVVFCVVAIALPGCSALESKPPLSTREAATPATSTLPGTPGNFSVPFSDYVDTSTASGTVYLPGAVATTTLSLAMARFDTPPNLPATEVAGAADAAVAGLKQHAGGIWIHYPTGIFLSIQREEFDARRDMAQFDAGGMALHPDGSPYLRVETIGGRETLVATEGKLVDRNGQAWSHGHEGQNVLNWSQGEWHYLMVPNGPRPASLDLMRAVAASVP